MRSFEVVLAAPKALPNHKQLRARCIAFLHRLVECLLGALLPYLPAALASLLYGRIDVGDMTEVLALLVQLLTRFKKELQALMEGLLPSLVPQVHQLLGEWGVPACGGRSCGLSADQTAVHKLRLS
jgi:hypothetical protein